MEKVSRLLVSLLQKKTGYNFYRFGGKSGLVQLKNGTGIMYIYNRNKAVRFNFDGKSLTGITLWSAYKLGTLGDYTVVIDPKMNIVSAARQLIDIILKPTVGKQELYVESMNLTEAKRISLEDFYILVSDNLLPGEQMSKLSWDRMVQIVKTNDFQLPSAIRNTKLVPVSGKGQNKTYDLTGLLGAKNADKPALPDISYSIQVVGKDNQTHQFFSTKKDPIAKGIMDTIDKAISNPSKEIIAKEAKDPNTLFGHMKSLTQVVARGKRNSLVITGGAGIGKSYTVFETLKEEGLSKGSGYTLIKGKITTATLYQTLYMQREGGLLVFDDCDSVWDTQDSANLLKAALDSYDERWVSWYSSRTLNVSKMDAEAVKEYSNKLDASLKDNSEGNTMKFPSEFEFKGRIIFISNLQMDKMDAAVLNRSTKIDMTMSTDDIFKRIETILPFIGSKEVDLEAKKDILDFIKTRAAQGVVTEPSIRTFVGAEDLYRSGLPNWKELLDYI